MKKQKTQSRLLVAMAAVIVLLVALSATLTFAWFTASQNSASQNMTFGKLALNNDNAFTMTRDNHTDTIEYVVPGCEINLAGSIDVLGNITAFVRAQLKVQVFAENAETNKINAAEYNELADTRSEESQLIKSDYVQVGEDYYLVADYSEAINYNGAENISTLSDAQVVFDKINRAMGDHGIDDWISYQGYIYYKEAVTATNQGTNVLSFANKKIKFNANETGNSWQGKKVVVSLGAQAIQAEHLNGEVAATDTFASEAGGNVKAVSDLAGQEAWSVDMTTGLSA